MTLPMTREDKNVSMEIMLKKLFKIHRKTQLVRNSLALAIEEQTDSTEFPECPFESDYIITAKNMALDISNHSQEIEHRLHEILDAPLVSESIIKE